MAEKDIIQNMISQLGQSQEERRAKALKIDFANVDERSTEDLLLFSKEFAKFVRFYPVKPSPLPLDWTKFFPPDKTEIEALLQRTDASVRPHLALFLSFLELYKKPQEVINRFTGRHLDFYYKDVLRLGKKAAVPDRVHAVLELKKQSPPIMISSGNVLSAGKDNTGVELIYTPIDNTVINTSKVDSLRSIFLDNTGHGTVRYAPIANSSDGIGGALPADDLKWYGFGHADLPSAEVGFAIASPLLRMKEGTRKVTVTLTLSNVDLTKLSPAALASALEVFITGEKNWLGPYVTLPTLSGGSLLTFEFTVPATDKAVIDYDAAVHGYSYVAQAPIVQVLLKADGASIGYNDLRGITLQKVRVEVDVSNVTALTLESDDGLLDPKKAFLPFGAQPTVGSRFMVGYDEALQKKLSEVTISVKWKDAPANFADRYRGYSGVSVTNSYFTAGVAFPDADSSSKAAPSVYLFGKTTGEQTFILAFTGGSFSVSSGSDLYALGASRSQWGKAAADRLILRKPVLSAFRTNPPEARSGFITFWLEKDFLHAAYRKQYVENVMTFSKSAGGGTLTLLNEPYAPSIQSISLSYKAQSDTVNIASTSLSDFSNPDIQFFHIAYFGQMREHGYQRDQFSFLTDKRVALLPAYDNEGELLIGFSNLNPGDSVSVLFQLAEGSADPELEPEDISWAVLCDNYWKPLGSDAVVLDSTNQLLISGLIKFVIPLDATTQNTIFPSSLIWLRHGVAQNVTAVCQLIEVAANAVEAQFTDQGNDPNHLLIALGAGTITKLKNGLSALKGVKQSYASFGGASEETDDHFHRRVSERLRHKNRCIAPWDYERIILEAFPQVHKVKCIPHAKGPDSWLAPGYVLVVVVPDLKNKNVMDPLEPKVDAGTISRITACLQERAGMQVLVKVKNPTYQRIQLDFKVKFYPGYEFNYNSELLKQKLIEFLSPWAFESSRDLSFGGRIYKSVLLDFVEKLAAVDYVTDFKMYSYIEGQAKMDVNQAQAKTPDAILVSDYTHVVKEAG